MIRARGLGAIALFIFACVPAFAQASETTKLEVSFAPYRLGANTTISSTFDIGATNGGLPAPPTKFEFRFPSSLNFSTSSLGLAICHPEGLEVAGLAGCPHNSQIGTGHAQVGVPVGSEMVKEETTLTALLGPSQGEDAGVLIFSDGVTPVLAETLFQGAMLEHNSAFGELLETSVPLVPSVPGAGDALVTKTELTIDPSGLTYYDREHGRTVSFHPRGFELPERCPSGGFKFGLLMQFADGTSVPASYTIPCPASPHHMHHRVRR